MQWTLNANGFIGDITATEKFFGDLKALLSRPENGAMGSMFTGAGKWETDFHKVAQVAADVTAPPDPPAAPPAGADPAISPVAASTATGSDTGQGDDVPETAPAPEQ